MSDVENENNNDFSITSDTDTNNINYRTVGNNNAILMLQMPSKEEVFEKKEIYGDIDILRIQTHDAKPVGRLYYEDNVIKFEGDVAPSAKTFVDFMIHYINSDVIGTKS